MTPRDVHHFFISRTDHPLYYQWFVLDADVQLWGQYVISGLANRIYKHTRKDQRTYQRKFCSFYARRATFIESHIEEFV